MKNLALFILVFITTIAWGQTTVILVRHAEKIQDDSKDPGLTQEGAARAQELVRVLSDAEVDEIYTTPFNRTRLTVEPLAQASGLEVKEYNPFDLQATADQIKEADGKTLIFSGHSNITPILVNLLLGEEKYKPLDERDYDNLYIVTINGDESSVIQLAYGAPSTF